MTLRHSRIERMNDRAVHMLLAALLERVGEAVGEAAAVVDALHDQEVATGGGAVVAVALCEQVVRIAQGFQADAVSALDRRRREVAGESQTEHDLCRSLFAEIGMARQTTATAGETTYRLARDLEDHPVAHTLLRDGEVNLAVVAAVCRETVYLDPLTRAEVDRELAPQLSTLGPKRAAAAARRLVLDREPHAAYERTVRAREERHVHLRRDLDAMATLSICAPAAQLVGVWHRLDAEASARRSDGDPRTIAQLACDLAVEALSGAPVTSGDAPVGVEVGVLMRPETLFGADDASAVLQGYGPVPAGLARALATSGRSWVRRFFTTTDGHRVVDVDPRRRRFPETVARMVRATDDLCARPWCECRVREIDHVTAYAAGGETTPANAQGLCRADNLLKQTRGWRVDQDATGVRTWRTPTGHRYAALDPPRGTPPSVVEHHLKRLVGGATERAPRPRRSALP